MIKILEVLGDQSLPNDFFESKKMKKFFQFSADYAIKTEQTNLKKIHSSINPDFVTMLQ